MSADELKQAALEALAEQAIVSAPLAQQLMRGSEAARRLRAAGERAPIVVCSGNVTDAGEIADGAARLSSLEAVDALWGKPFPDWKDGSLQRSLAEVLAAPASGAPKG